MGAVTLLTTPHTTPPLSTQGDDDADANGDDGDVDDDNGNDDDGGDGDSDGSGDNGDDGSLRPHSQLHLSLHKVAAHKKQQNPPSFTKRLLSPS